MGRIVGVAQAENWSDINCYFFFTEDLEDQLCLENALCCILHQIFDRHEHLLSKETLEVFQDSRESFFTCFLHLWWALVDASRQLDSGHIVVVLDAFDKCPEKARSVLLKAIDELNYYPRMGSDKLKFLITSRAYMQIPQDHEGLTARHIPINLSGDEDEGVNAQVSKETDIAIKARVNHLQEKLGLGDEETQLIRNKVTLVKNRTYLWAHLAFDAMEKSLRLERNNLEATINSIPRSLNEAYEMILDKSSDIATTKKLLQIILVARRPLSLPEMAVALSIKDTDNSFSKLLPNLPPDSQLRETITEQCGLFVVFHDSEVHLVHETARDFLIQRTTATDPTNGICAWSGSLCLKKSNYVLANACILVLHATYLAPSSQHDPSGFQRYAARFWSNHFLEAGKDVSEEQVKRGLALLTDPPDRGSWLQSCVEQEYLQDLVPSQMPPLMIASFFGLSLLVDHILQSQDFDLNAKDALVHRSALSWACAEGHVPVVESLLKHVSPYTTRFWSWTKWPTIVSARDKEGRQALMLAVEGGHLQCVKLLLDHGADVDAEIRYGSTALIEATINGDQAMVELLLSHGAKINTGPHDHSRDTSRPALAYAVEGGHLGIIQLLISKGAKIYDSDNNALSLAIHGADEAIIRLLLETCERIPSDCGLSNAAGDGRIAIVQLLLQRGAKVDAWVKHLDDGPALVAAAENGHVEIVQLLLENGADIDAEGLWRRALTAAAAEGHEDVVKLLIEKGADLEVQSPEDYLEDRTLTALARAAFDGDEAIVRLLLDGGASLETRTSKGETPLQLAVTEGRRDMVALLLLRGANPTVFLGSGGRRTSEYASGYVRDSEIRTMIHQAQERY
ncbi:hypothetical protein CEP52_005526 [Fusarium oligoseptatum]|uniref:Uncharacterized protein n=1 Tax=Fusarium oligoseptatum TaxID=2604345 RepID=A0A428TXU2_9HYPO|nr:hypothetical protein CEP52_005526 [Fusarium oligoseptatum]